MLTTNNLESYLEHEQTLYIKEAAERGVTATADELLGKVGSIHFKYGMLLSMFCELWNDPASARSRLRKSKPFFPGKS